MLFTRTGSAGTIVEYATMTPDRTAVVVATVVNGAVVPGTVVPVDGWPAYVERLAGAGYVLSVTRTPNLDLAVDAADTDRITVAGETHHLDPDDGDWVDQVDDLLTTLGVSRTSDWWPTTCGSLHATAQWILHSEVPEDMRYVVSGPLGAAQAAIDDALAAIIDGGCGDPVGVWTDRLALSGDPTQVGYRDRAELVATGAAGRGDYPETTGAALLAYADAVRCAGRGEVMYAVGRALAARFAASGKI